MTQKNVKSRPLNVKVDKTKNEEMISRFYIPDSPFVVITTKDGSFGTLGKYRLTHEYKSKEQCIYEVQKITWNRIIQVISLINEILK